MVTKICPACNKEFVKSKRYSYKQWASRRFCSQSCSGRFVPRKWKFPEEVKRKIGLAQLGRKRSLETRKEISEALAGRKTGRVPVNAFKVGCVSPNKGKHAWWAVNDKNVNWKGEDVGYIALHAWVRRKLGSPEECEHCQKQELKSYKIHWANKSGEYNRDITDWIRLCVPCHKKYDNERNKTNHCRESGRQD